MVRLRRSARIGIVLLASCGRLSFERSGDARGARDAEPPDAAAVLEGCSVRLEMEESAWSGGAGEVGNGCGTLAGRAVGGATVVDDLVRGRVAELVGDPSCIELSDDPTVRPTDQLTMSAWVYPTALDGTTPFGIVSKRVGFQLASDYTLFLWTGDAPWVDLDTENDRFGTSPVPAMTWTQLTVVYDGRLATLERVRIYRNGALEATGAESSATITSSAAPLRVGCMPDMQGSDVSFVGRLDDVALWMRALDDTEVASWYELTRR